MAKAPGVVDASARAGGSSAVAPAQLPWGEAAVVFLPLNGEGRAGFQQCVGGRGLAL